MNNLVAVCYPRNAGGKFLINCLGLSSGAVFQDSALAEQDIDSNLSPADKFNILLYQMPLYDWGMGCSQLFKYSAFDPRLITEKLNPIVDKLFLSNKLFFIIAHHPSELYTIRQRFSNLKTIKFINSVDFVRIRGQCEIFSNVWSNIRGAAWPELIPETLEDFQHLPPQILKEINDKFPYLLEYPINCLDIVDNSQFDILWDNNNYFSEEKTINEIKQLYNYFDLTDFNEELIRQFYQLWISKIGLLNDK